MVYKWLNNSLSFLYPPFCQLCGDTTVSDTGLCDHCLADLPTVTHTCQRCALPLEGQRIHAGICGSCLTDPPPFHRSISPFHYKPPVTRLIAQLKYQRQLNLVPLLSRALASLIDLQHHPVDALLPVPLHNRKLRQRGFNQALELARPLARQFGIPVLSHVERHRATPSQLALHASERRNNVRGAFRLRHSVDYRRIAIIDDVMTTGSTAGEIARLLVEDGVEHIQVWCIARA